MFRRHCIAAKVSDFGLRDLRAKGATDEYRAGRPIRELQNLLGHKSVRTTEIYLKELIPETVRPNERPMIAGSPKLGLLIYPSQWALSLQSNVDGSPTRARTWDLRINSPSSHRPETRASQRSWPNRPVIFSAGLPSFPL
jgi:integrase-like protein